MSATTTRRTHIHPTHFFISNGIPFIPTPQNEPYASIHDPDCSYGARGYSSSSRSSHSGSSSSTNADADIPSSSISRSPNSCNCNHCGRGGGGGGGGGSSSTDAEIRCTTDSNLRPNNSCKSEPPNRPSHSYPSLLWSGSILIAALVLVLPLALPTALPPPPPELLFLPLAILCLLLFQAITAGSGGDCAAHNFFIDPSAHGCRAAPVAAAAAICSGPLGGQFARKLTPPKDRSIPH